MSSLLIYNFQRGLDGIDIETLPVFASTLCMGINCHHNPTTNPTNTNLLQSMREHVMIEFACHGPDSAQLAHIVHL